MNFGKAPGRGSWFPGMHDSWKRAADFKIDLIARRRGPSWLGKTPEDFIQAAKERLLARQASWIGHREKTEEDYAAEAKAKLLQEKWIKYKRRMSERREYNPLGRGTHPKTEEEVAKEARDKTLQEGWVEWKRRVSTKREYNQLGRSRTKTPDELAQEARELKMHNGWVKWKKRLSEKREYNQLGRARSKTQDELERERIALGQEKGWLEPYRGNSLKKGWVRRYRGSLWNFNLEKSAAALKKVDELQEAKRLRKLELDWVRNIRKVQMPRGLGTEVKPKTEAELALEKTETELQNMWEAFTSKTKRKLTMFGLGPRRSFTSEELAKMARDDELENGWKRTYQREEEPTPRLVWLPRIKTHEELELEKLHTELENGWQDDVRMPEEPTPPLVWLPKIKTKEELRWEKIHKRQENTWYKKYKTYDELQTDFPTVQDLVIQELEKIWALEDMEFEVREARRLLMVQIVKENPDQYESARMYYNDKVDIDFEDSDDEE
ncbi:hypothetical protein MPTK2_8g13570 [Marchantia polymorpha subsp. ruderalis]